MDLDELLNVAWSIIANAGWDASTEEINLPKSPGWHEAAIRWRDDYFAYLSRRMSEESHKASDMYNM
jgi:hypothetical protein